MIKTHRSAHEYSAKRLRRARRLYFFLIAKYIPSGVDGIRLIKKLAPRLQENGFYSMTTDRRSIEFSFYRGIYKRRTKKINQVNRDSSWYEWLMANGYGNSPWYRKEMPEKRRIRCG